MNFTRNSMSHKEKRLAAAFGPCASGYEFDNAVAGEADPEIDDQSEVELVGLMPGSRWQNRHQDQEIKCIAAHDGDKGLCEIGPHIRLDTKGPQEVARPNVAA